MTVNPNDFELWEVRRGNSAYQLMVEGLRRYSRFYHGEPIQIAWVGLGTKSAYLPVLKADLMKSATPTQPRISTWWLLTEKGIAIIQKWLELGYNWQRIEAGDLPPMW